MLCAGAAVSRCCWAQGCQCVRQPLAHRGAAAIGPRNDDRSIICSARRCTVDSDAVLLRARHGGRHEGGGRRQRKRDEELVHLGCPLSSLNAECWRLLLTTQSNLETHRKRHDIPLEANCRLPGVLLWQRERRNWSERRPRRASRSQSPPPHAIAARPPPDGAKNPPRRKNQR